MNTKSLLYVLIVLAVAVAAAVALIPAAASKVTGQRQGAPSSNGGQRVPFVKDDQVGQQGDSQGKPALSENSSIDSATRSYMAWAKAIEQQRAKCLDDECPYQLPNGRWVR